MKIRPLHDRLLVERLEEKRSRRRDHYPGHGKEKPQEAKVIAVAPARSRRGQEIPLDVKAATRSCSEVLGSEVKIDDKEYLIMREDDVLPFSSKQEERDPCQSRSSLTRSRRRCSEASISRRRP